MYSRKLEQRLSFLPSMSICIVCVLCFVSHSFGCFMKFNDIESRIFLMTLVYGSVYACVCIYIFMKYIQIYRNMFVDLCALYGK